MDRHTLRSERVGECVTIMIQVDEGAVHGEDKSSCQ